jgi:phenylacetic acid degradation operon negative regulatory protein
MQEGNAPLTARSVLASALLGEDPPELPVAHLVRLAGLFGITGNRARVALSRMVATGEATTDGSGRYRLAGHLLERRLRQTVSRVGDTRRWDGRWRLVVVTTSGRAPGERLALRQRLALARLAERREGVWMRPDNIELLPDPSDDPQLALFTALPDENPAALVAALWDLGAWAGRAAELAAEMDRLAPSDPAHLAPGFELSAAVLRHLQADPLLPTALLPRGWPGQALRAAYEQWDRQYRGVLATWGRSL